VYSIAVDSRNRAHRAAGGVLFPPRALRASDPAMGRLQRALVLPDRRAQGSEPVATELQRLASVVTLQQQDDIRISAVISRPQRRGAAGIGRVRIGAMGQ
jgi:hypothetical protein